VVYHWYTMPSPRYGRLAPERRAHILAVARQHFAAGVEAASYNQIIAEAGISKTTAYLYFDGKQDLVGEVWRDLLVRLAEVMGPWQPAGSARRFWRQLEATSDSLRRHLVEHPEDLALLGQSVAVPESATLERWFADLVEDGVGLAIIRTDVPRPLLVAATIALFRVADEPVIAAMLRGEPADPEPGWQLLRALWGATPTTRTTKKG
jgi:AcrR family transcriptional regulator